MKTANATPFGGHNNMKSPFIQSPSAVPKGFVAVGACLLSFIHLCTAWADDTTNGKLTVDQNSSATALEVKGGATGNPMAVFRRDIGGDNQITITGIDDDPQIQFDDLLSGGAGKWTIGLEGDNSFRIAQSTYLHDNLNHFFVVNSAGNIGIGTTSPGNKLEVNGTIRAKEVIVETSGWPDYVFSEDYHLLPLSEVAVHIDSQGHLPGVPKASQMNSSGQSLGETQRLMMQKIEELTLYLIEKDKQILELKRRLSALEDAKDLGGSSGGFLPEKQKL